MCQKWILEPLFSEIYMKIEVFSSLEHNSTSAPIAQLAARLTFSFDLGQTKPDKSGHGFNSPLRQGVTLDTLFL